MSHPSLVLVVNRNDQSVEEDVDSLDTSQAGVSTFLELHNHTEPLLHQSIITHFHNLKGTNDVNIASPSTEHGEFSTSLNQALAGIAIADTVLHLADLIASAVDMFMAHITRGHTGNALGTVLIDRRFTNLKEREREA